MNILSFPCLSRLGDCIARRFMGHLRLLAACPKAPVLTLHLWVEENQVSESAEATGTRPKGIQGRMESIACWFWRIKEARGREDIIVFHGFNLHLPHMETVSPLTGKTQLRFTVMELNQVINSMHPLSFSLFRTFLPAFPYLLSPVPAIVNSLFSLFARVFWCPLKAGL